MYNSAKSLRTFSEKQQDFFKKALLLFHFFAIRKPRNSRIYSLKGIS